jgi:acyl-[acyl-carrier-protein]-phospholipid O-acyltransferase/long-chain-fatty-acid--[acyl-carrier-protein] ligase
VVVAVPDVRKGERTVMLTSDTSITREEFQRHARASGAPELMVPTEIMHVGSVPLLATGKPDFMAAVAMAKARVVTTDAAPISETAAA